ncbi:MAG TPA: hypothetical protein VHA52_13885, partial [Candidatus Babeliaceae bacterium]|nr:hypothetical protein [Candidatus Babeliaceae bacterium]
LGFTAGGKNLNYYDHKELREAAGPYILEKVKTQRRMMGGHERCICLGEGTNYKYFCKMNDLSGLYARIEPLPHPRWVMQYRRKRKDDYVRLYLEKLEGISGGK